MGYYHNIVPVTKDMIDQIDFDDVKSLNLLWKKYIDQCKNVIIPDEKKKVDLIIVTNVENVTYDELLNLFTSDPSTLLIIDGHSLSVKHEKFSNYKSLFKNELQKLKNSSAYYPYTYLPMMGLMTPNLYCFPTKNSIITFKNNEKKFSFMSMTNSKSFTYPWYSCKEGLDNTLKQAFVNPDITKIVIFCKDKYGKVFTPINHNPSKELLHDVIDKIEENLTEVCDVEKIYFDYNDLCEKTTSSSAPVPPTPVPPTPQTNQSVQISTLIKIENHDVKNELLSSESINIIKYHFEVIKNLLRNIDTVPYDKERKEYISLINELIQSTNVISSTIDESCHKKMFQRITCNNVNPFPLLKVSDYIPTN